MINKYELKTKLENTEMHRKKKIKFLQLYDLEITIIDILDISLRFIFYV